MMGVHHLGKQFQSKPISNHSVTTGFGCISLVDDYIKVRQNDKSSYNTLQKLGKITPQVLISIPVMRSL